MRNFFRTLLVPFLVFAVFFLPLRFVFAMDIASTNVTAASFVTSVSANYTFSFTLSGSASWAEGETFTITFPSGYSLVGLTEDDVDIADDGVDLTTAATCAGSEQMSVGIASQTMTFTMCAGDGGLVASSSLVEIEIGLHATSSGTSSNRLTNPTSAGSYFVALGGDVGANGSVIIPIVSDVSSGISLTVPVPDVEDPVNPPDGGCTTCGGGGNEFSYEIDALAYGIDLAIVQSTVSVLAYSDIELLVTITEGSAEDVSFAFQGETYAFEQISDQVWRAYVPMSSLDLSGEFFITDADDGNVWDPDLAFDVLEGGLVYEVLDEVTFPIAGATTTVLQGDGLPVGDSLGSQSAVQVSDSVGVLVGWYVPNGTYRTSTEKDGYQPAEFGFTVTNNILTPMVEMVSSDVVVTPEVSYTVGVRVFGFPLTVHDARVEVLENTAVDVTVAVTQGTAQAVSYAIHGDTYALLEISPGFWRTRVPTLTDDAEGVITVVDGEGGSSTAPLGFLVEPQGRVYEMVNGVVTPVVGATATVFLSDGSSGRGGVFNESAQRTSDAYGAGIGWYARNNTYSVRVARSGYQSAEVSFVTTNNLLNPSILLVREDVITEPTLSYTVDAAIYGIDLTLSGSTLSVLAQSSPDIFVTIQEGDASSVALAINDETTFFAETANNVWQARISSGSTNASGSFLVTDADGIVWDAPFSFAIVPPGNVYEVRDGEIVPIASAEVTLLASNGSVWDAGSYGQSATLLSGGDGSLSGWYVLHGAYLARAEKAGYETAEISLSAENNILAPSFLLVAQSEEIIPIPLPPEVPPETIPEIIGSIEDWLPDGISDVTERIVGAFDDAIEGGQGVSQNIARVQDIFAENASLRTLAQGAAVATLVPSALALAASGFHLWLLFLTFFSQPALFFARKKQQHVGIAYNSVTKIPLDFVTIRAFSLDTGLLVKTVVTNARGEFILQVARAGKYRLEAAKAGFVAPSVYLQDAREDGAYHDVYTGQSIETIAHGEPLAVAFPMDPVASPVPARVLRARRIRRHIALALSPLSVVASGVICILYPQLLTFTVLGAQVVLYVVTWNMTHRNRPRTWGVVYDSANKRPVGNVVIRLFETQYNKLVDSTLSDPKGRYAFALGPNEYYATFSKDGYEETTLKPIDYRAKPALTLFGVPLALRRKNR